MKSSFLTKTLLIAPILLHLAAPLSDGSADDFGMQDRSSARALGVAPADEEDEGAIGAPSYPAHYETGRTYSPINPFVARNLRRIVEQGSGRENVVIKVGASATESINFLHCLAWSSRDLASHTDLEDTLDFFAAGEIAGENPFNRESRSARVGRGAAWALSGEPSPLDAEIGVARPRYAVIMYGTNDINQTTVFEYANSVLEITDRLIADGVIPIWTTIMPRDDDPEADLRVPAFNMAMRAVAEIRQVPLIDYYRELSRLPDHGLGGDNLHPSRYPEGACVFDEEGLRYGYNIRNLLTLRMLDRVRAVVDGAEPPDESGAALVGSGTADDPWVIDRFPFAHRGNTIFSEHAELSGYEGCRATQDETGPELHYRIVLEERTRVRVLVFDRDDVDIDAHILSGPNAEDCVARDHQDLTVWLDPGTHHLVLDTFVDAMGRERSGEYVVAVMTSR